MGIENNKSYTEFEERSFRRVLLKHPAKYTLIEGKKGWGNCTIININKNLKGMGIIFHTREKIPVTAKVIIDLLTDGKKGPLCITGVLRWIEDTKIGFIGGLELMGDIEKVAVFFNSKKSNLKAEK